MYMLNDLLLVNVFRSRYDLCNSKNLKCFIFNDQFQCYSVKLKKAKTCTVHLEKYLLFFANFRSTVCQ